MIYCVSHPAVSKNRHWVEVVAFVCGARAPAFCPIPACGRGVLPDPWARQVASKETPREMGALTRGTWAEPWGGRSPCCPGA